ncbi:PLP-dependent aminotransferase family protein [Curvibacter sp. CHRR-16]|uniref:MocR-like pyridoxine biosynthesis transcription factor PdxR n=1 Tax=Curvibacter sp. CHRR-16 TaxID=2835872 RepID=UPI001BD985DC|nr:PLP-dependent aminotransferase family protein [Curvibacter sp. CHRR-16]MBT0570905.1 PLP-dependent aminotransferase family protein [Curvibacter sp. CHRR-16]
MKPAQPSLWTTLFDAAASSQGLRERVCAALRQAMRSGTLAAGQRLPASRVLAQDLGVSRVTVEAAYAQLEAEGYVMRHTGRGSFVAELQAMPQTRATGRVPSTPAKPATPLALSRRGQMLVNTGGCMEPLQLQAFAAGSPDLRAFDHALWRQLSARLLRTQPQDLMRYGDPQGRQDLRQALTQYLTQSRAVACTAEQVLVLTSSQQALQLLATALLDPGQRVWVEDPGYRGARTAFEAAGATVVPMPVDAQGLVPDFTLEPPRLIYLTPSHQYPTGATLSLERRMALVDYAHQHGCWIVEDDYDSEFLYDARATPSLQGLDGGQRVIYVGTFSKTLFPSLRLAYAVLPPELVIPLVTARSVMDGHSAQWPQAVTAQFMEQGYFAAHLRHMRRLYRSRRDLLLQALAQHCPWAQPLPCNGGLQMVVLLPHGTEQKLTLTAAALGVATPRLGPLYAKPNAVDGWLLGFAALEPAEIERAAALLGKLRP